MFQELRLFVYLLCKINHLPDIRDVNAHTICNSGHKASHVTIVKIGLNSFRCFLKEQNNSQYSCIS
jgi:hypothetical protein